MIDRYSDTNPQILEGYNGESILLIHGFAGSPTEMLGLGDYLQSLGYTVAIPLLPGHGTNLQDFSTATMANWLDAVITAIENLRARYYQVHVVGHSLGALLALLAAREQEVDKLILSSPAMLQYLMLRKLLLRLAGVFVNNLPLGSVSFDEFPPPYRHVSYSKWPVKATLQLLKLIEAVGESKDWTKLAVPVLILIGEKDLLIPQNSADQLRNMLQSADVTVARFQAGHPLLVSKGREQAWEKIVEFIET